jgi:outer membrane protein assembly factor BamB
VEPLAAGDPRQVGGTGGSNDNRVQALRASDGKQLLSFTADGPVESQIAVAGGIAYFGSEQVYALKGPPT